MKQRCAPEITDLRELPCTSLWSLASCVPGAIVHARIEKLVFAARDLRFGGVRSKFRLADSDLLNHQVDIIEGVCGPESIAMLQAFFAKRR